MSNAEVATPPVDDGGIVQTWRLAPAPAKALLVGTFVNRLGSFIQIFLVLFLTWRGLSSEQAGGALGTYTAGAVVGVISGGTLTSLLGPRRTILLSMGGTAALVVSILYLHNYLALVGALFVIGTVNGAYRPAASTLLAELTPKHRQVMIFAMYRLAYNLGSTAAPLIAAALVVVSYNLLFWGEAAASVAFAVIAAVALPRRGPSTTEREATPPPGGTGYLAVLADGRFTLFLLALLINSVVYVQYVVVLPIAMRTSGLGTIWFSAAVALNGAIVITCELLVTKVVQRWPMRLVVMVGFLLLGGGQAIYALPAAGAAAFIGGTLVWTLAEIVAGPTMAAYPALAGPPRLRSRYIAASTAAFGAGSASGSVLGLAVWNHIGSAVWLWCAAACLVGYAAAFGGMRRSVMASVSESRNAASETSGAADDNPPQALEHLVDGPMVDTDLDTVER
jgi:MFS family permease